MKYWFVGNDHTALGGSFEMTLQKAVAQMASKESRISAIIEN